MMDTPTRTTTTKSGGSSKTDPGQTIRAMTENGAKEALDKMSAATAEATNVMQNYYTTAVKGAQDYNSRVIDFARANAEATLEFVQKLSSVKSPSEFFEMSTNHSRRQFEMLSEQTKELTALGQEVMQATMEPLKTGAMKAFNRPS